MSQTRGDGILEGLDDLADAPQRIRSRDDVMSQTGGGGILESLDDMHDARRKGLAKRELFVELGVRLEHTGDRADNQSLDGVQQFTLGHRSRF